MNNTHKMLRIALAVIGCLLLVFVLPWSVASLAGSTILFGTVITDATQTNTPSAHLPPDMSITLTKYRPDLFPMDTIMRRLDTKRSVVRAKQRKVEWEEVGYIPRGDAANGASGAGASGAAVTFTVDNGGYFRKDDLLYLPDNATAPATTLLVTAVSGNDLTVRAIGSSAYGTVPAIADNEVVKRLGNAKEEFSDASASRAMTPSQFYNYTEIFDAVVGVSGTRKATQNYGEHDFSRMQGDAMFDFRYSLELTGIFGKRSIIPDANSQKTRTTMGGIVSYLSSNDLNYTAGSLTEANLIDFCKQIFSGNAGAKVRLLFTTPNLTAEIDKILISSSTLQSTRDEKVLGVSATRIHSTFGDLMLINHYGLEEMGKSNWGLVVDPQNVRRRPMRPMTTKDVTDKNKDGEAKQWLEECSLEVRYEKTHAVVRDTATDSFA